MPSPAAMTLWMIGCTADFVREEKMSVADEMPRMSWKFEVVQFWGHQYTVPGGFHSSAGLNDIVSVQ